MVQAPPGDLLYGAKAIAEYLGISRRQAYTLVEAGRLPFFKNGGTVCARKSTLSTWLAEQEAKGGEGTSHG